MTLVQEIKQCIEEQLDKKRNKFIIYPYGDVGIKVNQILKEVYNLNPEYIIDNNLSKYNFNIKPLTFLKDINLEDYTLILASTNSEIYMNLKNNAIKYFNENNIIELQSMKIQDISKNEKNTKVGKYSFGPLCEHYLVESIGAFCSFASGAVVVENHPVEYLSTHPFLYTDKKINNLFEDYNCEEYKKTVWYFPGVLPQKRGSKIETFKKTKIGNDVWLGHNVIITNGVNIGNGVIAAAGAVITKDVPDYAVVGGVPARIIRYRYNQKQIEALNRIEWWNWSDEQIRERYNDFYISIDEFIMKYDKKNF